MRILIIEVGGHRHLGSVAGIKMIVHVGLAVVAGMVELVQHILERFGLDFAPLLHKGRLCGKLLAALEVVGELFLEGVAAHAEDDAKHPLEGQCAFAGEISAGVGNELGGVLHDDRDGFAQGMLHHGSLPSGSIVALA